MLIADAATITFRRRHADAPDAFFARYSLALTLRFRHTPRWRRHAAADDAAMILMMSALPLFAAPAPI
jgi:hypothetical protein